MRQFVAEIPAARGASNLRVLDTVHEDPTRAFFVDAVNGLSASPKHLEPKYFYDQRGSELFDEICRTPEYYPTRTEMALLRRHAGDIADLIGPEAHVIEFGSGATVKVRLLLDALTHPSSYLGVDISRDYLVQAAQALAQTYPDMPVVAFCTDFTRPFRVPPLPGHGPRLGFFPGSTIGNFAPVDARAFLRQAMTVLRGGGAMIVGVDLKKDEETLNAAYNDAEGVTAAFNLNLLTRMNRELGANFDISRFVHEAFYNADHGRVEMHLRSLEDQQVQLAGQTFAFQKDERLHTENSYKYDVTEFHALARGAGLRPVRTWVDADRLFSIHYLSVPR